MTEKLAPGRQHDSHVRARAALARKVAQERINDGMNPVASASTRWALGKMPTVEVLLPAAFEAIAAYKWPEGWGVKYSRFRMGGRPMYVDGQTRDVPARIVRNISRLGMPPLPQFTCADRKRLADERSVEAEPADSSEEDEYDFDEAVEEARAHLEKMKFAETDADDGLLATPAGDSTIDRRRRESLDAGYRVEEAEIALEKALREQRLFGRGAAEVA